MGGPQPGLGAGSRTSAQVKDAFNVPEAVPQDSTEKGTQVLRHFETVLPTRRFFRASRTIDKRTRSLMTTTSCLRTNVPSGDWWCARKGSP
jgi:hypothetical protein